MIKDSSEKATAIKVFVRVRPLVGPEIGTNEVVTVHPDVPVLIVRARQCRYRLTPCR